ncbi:MAG: asparagine synthase (glutamine-hydrolyzing) [Actinomycetales bacterium]|nr:asparagine synthase (glutamine-hydrolyzing) [Actinomycetales bacterium]MCP4892903.1 asparagine synthase (glutamine-hydrolyzing) [Actinomycetales bacterium]
MCGIWVSVGSKASRRHLDCISHRGPDDEGWEEFQHGDRWLTLGHRRLSIIDLSEAGHQPMRSRDDRVSIVFNGEIYNHGALRRSLEREGSQLRSTCDTEALLETFARRGVDCLPDLQGMFGFVAYDHSRRVITAVRDRFGIKPLYMIRSGSEIAFASEIKQFIGFAGFRPRIDIRSAFDFLASGFLDHTDRTMFEGVTQIDPGSFVEIDVDSMEVRTRRWYELPTPGSIDCSSREAAERYGNILSESVGMHVVADVPVGSCLSGGLDSSSIVCLMRDHLNAEAEVHTITARYEHQRVDEGHHAAMVADAVDAIPHETYPDWNDCFKTARQITWHQDEPFGSTSVFAQWKVFEAARRQGLKVMLDGQGADEPLGGYHGLIPIRLAELVRDRRLLAYAAEVGFGRLRHGRGISHELASRFVPTRMQQRFPKRFGGTPDDPLGWLRSERFQDLLGRRNPLGEAASHAGIPTPSDLGSWCLAMTRCSNLAMLLHWEDRNSMAHSIEARVPFLDHRLVELAVGFGGEHKLVRGTTKSVLRKSMAGILPEPIRNRHDKLGFATPEAEWFRGPLRGQITSAIDATLDTFPDLLDADAVRKLRDEMLAGDRVFDFTLWRIASLGIWGDVFEVEE